MSDEPPTRVTGGMHVATAADAAQQAGRVRAAVDPDDPVTQLEMQVKAFIDGANLTSHARMMALPKMAEMFFWIRAGMGRG